MTAIDLTRLLNQASNGDSETNEELARCLYSDLRRLAAVIMRGEPQGRTLQPTALVHEAWLRLMGGEATWENRAHFFGSAARAMRQILVDSARRRAAEKRGGNPLRVTFEDLGLAVQEQNAEVLALDSALAELEAGEPRLAKVVELRYFAGCSIEETAEIVGCSPASVKRDWFYARAWLHERLTA